MSLSAFRITRKAALTSTCQPSFLMYSQSSRDVLTLFESTAVQVGKMAPSPSSIAETSLRRSHNTHTTISLPISLCVNTRPPNLYNKGHNIAHIRGHMTKSHLTPSARMSFLSRCSIASRFSGRSERGRVFLGSDESRRTKGRPDMYTDCPQRRKESLRLESRHGITNGLFSC